MWTAAHGERVRFVVVRVLTHWEDCGAGPESADGPRACVRPVPVQPGLEEARGPQPLATTALLSFHDAAEMFLGLAADHLGVNPSQNVTFDGYFAEIKQNAGVELPSRHPMRRMNRSRVNLKTTGSFLRRPTWLNSGATSPRS